MRLSLISLQGVSNIITDIVYIVAPLIYLSTIQLPRRTQWGIRVVFCLGLMSVVFPPYYPTLSLKILTSVTICSAMKTRELGALTKTKDPTWDGVNLAIWSATELSVGILIASLPPLRKVFDSFFRALLPTIRTKTKSHTGIPMYNVSKHYTIGSSPVARSRGENDDDSVREIWPESEVITKTVVHEVVSEEWVGGEAVRRPTKMYSTYEKTNH